MPPGMETREQFQRQRGVPQQVWESAFFQWDERPVSFIFNNSSSLQLTTGMTLEAWVNPSTASSAWRDVIYKADDNYYLEGTSDNSSRPAAGGTFSGTPLYGTAALNINTWAHLALTYDKITLRLFVNGVQVASRAQTANIATSTNPLQIGGDSLYGQYFQGLIDEVRIYNLALTAAQIQSDMATPVGSPIQDTQPPSPPANLVATAFSANQIDLSWTASTDNVGVTGYLIERQDPAAQTFTQIGSTTALAFSNSNLVASTAYTYRVRATDAAGNLSSYSSPASATTLTPDTEPPSAPGNLVATTVSGSEIDLTWSAATDNVGVTGYRVERCLGGPGCTDFVKLAYPTSTTFNDTGLAPNTTYTYIVRATDAAGNLGDYSTQVTATTLSTPPSLVAAYSFDEGVGTTVSDTSGNNNTGSIAGATWTNNGKYGKALVFNGLSDLVTINNSPSLQLTTGMTLEAWVNPTFVSSSWRDVIYKGDDNYYLEGTSASGGVPAVGGTFGGPLYAAAALSLNTWSHLAASYDGTNIQLFVNGVMVATNPQTGNVATSGNPLQIGGDSIYGQYFQGILMKSAFTTERSLRGRFRRIWPRR